MGVVLCMASLLLVHGTEIERQALVRKLQPSGVTIPWHWETKNKASRTPIPTSCDGVLVMREGCPHTLYYTVVGKARAAGVPLITHDSWARTFEALHVAKLCSPLPATPHHGQTMLPPDTRPTIRVAAPPAVSPSPIHKLIVSTITPDLTPVRPLARPLTGDVIVDAHTAYTDAPESIRRSLREVAAIADGGATPTAMPDDLRAFLAQYDGNPRAVTALVLLATHEKHITASAVSRVYLAACGKIAQSTCISDTAREVAGLCGTQYGLRKGVPGANFKKVINDAAIDLIIEEMKNPSTKNVMPQIVMPQVVAPPKVVAPPVVQPRGGSEDRNQMSPDTARALSHFAKAVEQENRLRATLNDLTERALVKGNPREVLEGMGYPTAQVKAYYTLQGLVWEEVVPTVVVEPLKPSDKARARFRMMLDAAIDTGETVTARQDGEAFYLSYDGVEVRIK